MCKVLKFVTPDGVSEKKTGSQKKKTQKNFAFFAKITQF